MITKPAALSPGQTAVSTTYWGSMTPTPEEWQQQDAYAKGMVVLNVKNPIGHGVKTDGTVVNELS